ncbi:MAG: hypothetical protein WA532_09825 [Candidatus Korobacteraceae bacterium]
MNTQITDTALHQVWATLFPEIAPPAEHQFALWRMLHHDENTVKAGLAELATKFHRMGGQMEYDHMLRFASAVMNRITRDQRQANNRRLWKAEV